MRNNTIIATLPENFILPIQNSVPGVFPFSWGYPTIEDIDVKRKYYEQSLDLSIEQTDLYKNMITEHNLLANLYCIREPDEEH